VVIIATPRSKLAQPAPADQENHERSGREQTGTELTAEEILDSPHMFIGSTKDLARKFADLRERFGISSFLIDDLGTLAPVVEQLAGQ
jgi:hypothetical protein